MSRSEKPVIPSDGETYRFYCCGPTVYGPAHIGNFRTFLVQDLFRRTLEATGIQTKHVRNVTDVDDKTIRVSQEEGKTLTDFTASWLHQFQTDAAALAMLPPHVEPGAVDHIPEQIELIEKLIAKGHAYASEDGSVYFKVDSYPSYGRLSRLDEREIQHGAGETTDNDEYEKDSLSDFALWKARKPADGENHWPSPWGEGRPGWHLECSAMGIKYLSETFDLHSGGVDLCFPHHENEIAQSEAVTGQPFALHWFHIEHLLVDGRKMSKSLGNLYTLNDLTKLGHSPAELRYALLAGHYRQKLNFSLDRLHDAKINLERLSKAATALEAAAPNTTKTPDPGPFLPAWQALLSDLNMPASLGTLFGTLKGIEKQLSNNTIKPEEATAAHNGLHFMLNVYGFELPSLSAPPTTEVPPEITALAEKRSEAKTNKDWSTADSLRDEIQAAGWNIIDTKDGFELKPNQ